VHERALPIRRARARGRRSASVERVVVVAADATVGPAALGPSSRSDRLEPSTNGSRRSARRHRANRRAEPTPQRRAQRSSRAASSRSAIASRDRVEQRPCRDGSRSGDAIHRRERRTIGGIRRVEKRHVALQPMPAPVDAAPPEGASIDLADGSHPSGGRINRSCGWQLSQPTVRRVALRLRLLRKRAQVERVNGGSSSAKRCALSAHASHGAR
jgi:hypothetical protein